jgi:hypothetical protein
MPSIINASSTGSGGIVQTADASGVLQLQSNGTTALTVSGANVTFAGTQTLTNNITTTGSINALNTFGFENRIINGGMTIDQRNGGASVTPSATGVVYTLDRWYLFSSPTASKFSVQQVAAPSGFTGLTSAALITTVSAIAGAAGDVYAFDQAIEGYNIADLKWGTASPKTITISFWAQASITGAYAVSILAAGGNASYSTTVSLVANTATFCSVTIPGPTIGTYSTTNGVGFFVIFDMGGGSSNESPSPNSWVAGNYASVAGSVKLVRNAGATLYISGVQLEQGTQATSFDFRDYGTELVRCQRYFQGVSGVGRVSTSSNVEFWCKNPVVMRATPSATIKSGAQGYQFGRAASALSSMTTFYLGADGAGVTFTSADTGMTPGLPAGCFGDVALLSAEYT